MNTILFCKLYQTRENVLHNNVYNNPILNKSVHMKSTYSIKCKSAKKDGTRNKEPTKILQHKQMRMVSHTLALEWAKSRCHANAVIAAPPLFITETTEFFSQRYLHLNHNVASTVSQQ